jgi:NADH-dependent peroxiredoxin subunit C
LAAVAAIHHHLKNLDAELLAISTDSIQAHHVFKQMTPALGNLPFVLLSDRSQEISKAYQVLDESTGNALRASFFIDPEQTIQAKFIYPDKVGRNMPEHVRLLQALQYSWETGQGTPANWMPGST